MPTSNSNQTDTNNNSNNKIIANGRSEQLVASSLRGPSSLTSVAVNSALLTANSHSQQENQINQQYQQQQVQQLRQDQQQETVVAAMASSQIPLIPLSLKHDQQQQQHNNHINNNNNDINNVTRQTQQQPSRNFKELSQLLKDINFDRTSLTNEELIKLVKNQQVSVYKLESFLGKDNAARCVEVRRDYYRLELAELDKLDQIGIHDRHKAFNHPRYEDLEYEKVNGACCENVIGHVKVPVGIAGPLVLDGNEIFVPLATTEGCLVASTCRGLSALRKSGGVTSRVRKDFMTRAPIVRFRDPRLRDALDNVERAIAWLNDENNKEKMRAAFNLTSSHGKFLNYTMYPINREIHIRFEAQTGDAMGMNMCSKGVESALKEMQKAFPTMEIVTLSGNMCTDKKAAGINWINGRGKSVECTAEMPAHVVQQVFKVSVDSMIDRWKSKVMVGSALAASIGGFNSQAANILTAIFIATGQDPAQNVTSSNCMLILEKDSKGSLVVCCTMPSIECGTVGGGTILADQSRYLQMMGVKGPTPKHPNLSYNSSSDNSVKRREHQLSTNNSKSSNHINEHGQNITHNDNNSYSDSSSLHNNLGADNGTNDNTNNNANSASPTSSSTSSNNNRINKNAIYHSAPINSTNGYTNARKLARIICATVMAGELSLLAALTEGTLVKSHMRHNRSSTNVTANSLACGFNSCGGGNSGSSRALISNNNRSSYNSVTASAKGGGGGGDGGGACSIANNSMC